MINSECSQAALQPVPEVERNTQATRVEGWQVLRQIIASGTETGFVTPDAAPDLSPGAWKSSQGLLLPQYLDCKKDSFVKLRFLTNAAAGTVTFTLVSFAPDGPGCILVSNGKVPTMAKGELLALDIVGTCHSANSVVNKHPFTGVDRTDSWFEINSIANFTAVKDRQVFANHTTEAGITGLDIEIEVDVRGDAVLGAFVTALGTATKGLVGAKIVE